MSILKFRNLFARQDASAMTEFVVGLPIFILLFVGILSFQRIGRAGVIVKAEAHSKMWVKAIGVTKNLMPGWSMSPVTAAVEAGVFHGKTGGSALDYALDSGAGVAAVTGVSGGIMGESYSRVRPFDVVENIGDADGEVTYKLNESYLIADKKFIAYDLMNDAVNYSPGAGGGALGVLNNIVTGLGARPAIAAGIRYGISGDYSTKDVKLFGGQTATFEARSHVANAPRPTSRYITVAVVRLAMAKEKDYDVAIKFTIVPDLGAILSGAYDMAKSFFNPFKRSERKKDKKNEGRKQLSDFIAVFPCRASLCP
jgi:hypothetical protein